MTVLLIFVVLNCSMARYNGRLHCIAGVLPTCYKRKAATYFYPPGGTGPSCNEPFTVKHFLITCTEFNYIRNRYFTAKTFKELFSDTSSDKIINFFKETNLFNKL